MHEMHNTSWMYLHFFSDTCISEYSNNGNVDLSHFSTSGIAFLGPDDAFVNLHHTTDTTWRTADVTLFSISSFTRPSHPARWGGGEASAGGG